MVLFQIVPFFFIIAGILSIIFPKFSWYMKTGWQFKNAEPSDLAIITIRIGGVIAIVIGIFILVSGFPFNIGPSF
jgi:hypothetical protein